MEKTILTIQFTKEEVDTLIGALTASIDRDESEGYPKQQSEVKLREYLQSSLSKLQSWENTSMGEQ